MMPVQKSLRNLIDQADDWGIKASFETDIYRMNGHVGSFLYVVAGNILENNNGKYSTVNLHDISGKFKTIIGTRYRDYTMAFSNGSDDNNQESISGRLLDYGNSQATVKYLLQQDSDVEDLDIFNHAADLSETPAEPSVMLKWLYDAKIKTPADAISLNSLQSHNNDSFIHFLVSLKATSDTNTMLSDFLSKVEAYQQGTAEKVAEAPGEGKLRPLMRCLSDDIAGEDLEQRQIMITKLINVGNKDCGLNIDSQAIY